jgi:hypothetical protein
MSSITVPYEVGSGAPIDGIEEALTQAAERSSPHPEVVAWVEALTPKEAAFLADFIAQYTGPPRWVLVEATAAYLRAWMRERAARPEGQP